LHDHASASDRRQMSTPSARTIDDGFVEGVNSRSDPAAQPGPCVDRTGESVFDSARSFTLEVDGELFAVRPDEHGGSDYTWLSGPNEGYGFGESPTPNRSLEEHRESIRIFLAQVDPATGYIEQD
jgi:hypothetical protein